MNTKKKEEDTLDIPQVKTLMPLDDPIYSGYLEKLQAFFPTVTFMTEMPTGAPKFFHGGKYTFFASIPVVVNIQRQSGNFTTSILNRLMIANIIDPPKYDEILQYKKHEDIEHLQYWRTEVPSKNPEYFQLQEYCKNKNIILFETLYIDKIKNRIADLHTLVNK